MTRPPFDPNELDQPSTDAGRAIAELDSYLADTATGAPRGLGERVMAAIEQEPVPHRGFLSWLLMPAGANNGLRRVARAGVLAATLVVAIGGAIFAGQLTGLIRNVGSGSPTPVESVSPAPSESLAPSPTATPEATSSGSPEASEDVHQSPGASETPDASEDETPEASPEESRTPRPTKTGSPSPTPSPTS